MIYGEDVPSQSIDRISQLPKRCCSQCNVQSQNSGKLVFLSWGVYYGLLQKMKPLTPRPSGEKWEIHSCFWCTLGKFHQESLDIFRPKSREKSTDSWSSEEDLAMRNWALESLEQEGETTRMMSAWMLTNSRSKQQYNRIYIYIHDIIDIYI